MRCGRAADERARERSPSRPWQGAHEGQVDVHVRVDETREDQAVAGVDNFEPLARRKRHARGSIERSMRVITPPPEHVGVGGAGGGHEPAALDEHGHARSFC